MATTLHNDARDAVGPKVEGAEYPIYGSAAAGGPYNSHIYTGIVVAALTAVGWVNLWLTCWIGGCLLVALLLDARSWKRKVVLSAIPAQAFLYGQVLLRAAWDALPFYAFAYVIYVCVAPIWRQANLAVSSFVMLYSFYMVVRAYWLCRYLWLLTYRWEDAGRTFAVHEANLNSRSAALRHVLWAYFLGNIGLVVRCASQVVTIALFERLRNSLQMDLASYSQFQPHLVAICVAATAVWLATMWWAIRRALLIYYRTHRTFHECRPLYDSIHSIHHRGVLPTPLDSGTISPAEFFITEMAFPAGTIVPNWYFAITQIAIAVAGHWPSHDAGTRMKFAQHHLAHHRFFTVNYGLTPGEDERYGTLFSTNETAEASVA